MFLVAGPPGLQASVAFGMETHPAEFMWEHADGFRGSSKRASVGYATSDRWVSDPLRDPLMRVHHVKACLMQRSLEGGCDEIELWRC